MIVREPRSDLFLATCSGCGATLLIDSDSGFGAASLAARDGWFIGIKDDFCRDCGAPKPAARRR